MKAGETRGKVLSGPSRGEGGNIGTPVTGAKRHKLPEKAYPTITAPSAASYIYNDELFWGQDRLEFLDQALAKDGGGGGSGVRMGHSRG